MLKAASGIACIDLALLKAHNTLAFAFLGAFFLLCHFFPLTRSFNDAYSYLITMLGGFL
jgi:hypothetical protein